MRHKVWLMDSVCPPYLNFRGRNQYCDILAGTGGDPGEQQPSGVARAFIETQHNQGSSEAMFWAILPSFKVDSDGCR